jgi:RimJ/RimL family protein N-acetyltransferase
MPIGPGDVYLVDAWTDARYRGHALAHVLCLHQLRHFRAFGFRRAVRGTVPENPSALRVHAKSGFRPIAMLVRIRIGPWRWHARRDRRHL